MVGEAEFTKKGIGTAIVRLLVQKIMETKEYSCIIADPDDDNKASARVLEKNGFSQLPDGIYMRDI